MQFGSDSRLLAAYNYGDCIGSAGFSKCISSMLQVLDNLDTSDAALLIFQLQAALYLAAHYGQTDLAIILIRYDQVKHRCV